MLQPSLGNGVALHRDDGKAYDLESISQGFFSHLKWVLHRKAVTKALPTLLFPTLSLPRRSFLAHS